MEGWSKEDTPIRKKFPVGIDIPEFLVELGMSKDATKVVKAVVDYALIASYYFLQLGEYRVKG